MSKLYSAIAEENGMPEDIVLIAKNLGKIFKTTPNFFFQCVEFHHAKYLTIRLSYSEFNNTFRLYGGSDLFDIKSCAMFAQEISLDKDFIDCISLAVNDYKTIALYHTIGIKPKTKSYHVC